MDRAGLIAFAADLTRRRAGFDIPRGPGALELRLGPLARREGADSPWALLESAQRQPDSKLAGEIVEALAPRETCFFRDRAPFRIIAEHILPAACERAGGEGRVRIWSAGCGEGQEAYSLAMIAEERRARAKPTDVRIVATDLSRSALRRAARGLYDQFEVQRGLPIRRLVEHFEKEGEEWRIAQALRRTIDFRAMNLLDSAEALGEFDIVLLRHVLGDLAADLRDTVLGNALARLRPGGWLILGPGDEAAAFAAELEPVPAAAGIYRVRADAPPRSLDARRAA